VDSAVIPSLGASIKTGDDLTDSGRLSPRRKGPPLAQLIKGKANSRGDEEHDQEGAMPGDFPLQQRRGSRRVSHENSPWIEDDLPYVRRQPGTLCPHYKTPCRLRRHRLHIIRRGGDFFRLEDDQWKRRDGDKGTVLSSSRDPAGD